MADDVVIIDRGRSVTQASLAQLQAAHPGCSLEDIYLRLTGDREKELA